jgi:hypothetical protein
MGVFENGSEMAEYQELYCSRCVHHRALATSVDEGCQVLAVHWRYGRYGRYWRYSGTEILDALIPRVERGVNGNGRCRMFLQNYAKTPLPESAP